MKVFSIVFVAASVLQLATAQKSGSITTDTAGNVNIKGVDVVFKTDTGDISAFALDKARIDGEAALVASEAAVAKKMNDIQDEVEKTVQTAVDDLTQQSQDTADDAAKGVADLDAKLDARVTADIAKIVSDAAEKLCQNGQEWNSNSKKCTGSPVLLSKSDLACDTNNNGLVKLDAKGKMVVCNGGKKKYTGVGSGAGGEKSGLAEDTPATGCEGAVMASPYQLKSGKFWVLGNDKTTAFQRVCEINTDGTAEDLGGDGSDSNNAARDCWALKDYWGKEGTGSFYLRSGKTDCDFNIGAPLESGTWGGVVNKYAAMTKDYSKGYTGGIELENRNGQRNSFKFGDTVLIHQTQHKNKDLAGQYEWNVIKKELDGAEATLLFPLKHNYCSGKFDTTDGSACVTQLVRTPYVKTGLIKSKVTAYPWDGHIGGIVSLKATEKISVNSDVDVSCQGFRGGYEHYKFQTNGGCRAHPSAGDQGESYKGRGKMDGVTAGFNCCSGPRNAWEANGYKGRGKANGGGGGGGAGACHGGGGGGGGYGTYTNVPKCTNSCGHRGRAGDGSPECYRAGSWATRGDSTGDAEMVRPQLGNGGGGGNSYSPNSRDKNGGGEGGGLIFIDGGKQVEFGSGKLKSNGCQGWPRKGTGLANWWQRSNSQDGSGGSGSGGGVKLEARKSQSTINLNGNGRVEIKGGPCGTNTGWRPGAQTGAAGGNGRFAAVAKTVKGSAATESYKKVAP